MNKTLFTCILSIFAAIAFPFYIYACTGVYVGKNVSEEGTTIIARSEDYSSGSHPKHFMVQERIDKAGRYLEDIGNGLKVELPKVTYKYTHLADSSYTKEGLYPGVCMNEMGLNVIGTVSAKASDEYYKLDPLEEDEGLREAILPALIAAQAQNAREACEITAKLVDKYGSCEGNILLLSDREEAWIFEIYGGSSYCAIKLDPNMVSVFGNQFMIDWVDSKAKDKDHIYSKNLFKTLDSLDSVVKKGSKYNITESIKPERSDNDNMRNWEGIRLFAGDKQAGEYDSGIYYPLQFTPEKNISVIDIMNLYRDRYEGTSYDMRLGGNDFYRPIGTTRQTNVHIVQVFSELPKESCSIQWLALGNAECSGFVPSFSGINDTLDAYKIDGSAYDPKSAYWAFKRIGVISQSDRTYLSEGVINFWQTAEKKWLDRVLNELPSVESKYKKSSQEGSKYVTELSMDFMKEAIENSDILYNSLLYKCADNYQDTVKNSSAYFYMPVPLVSYAEEKGYKVNKNKDVYTLKKGKNTFTLEVNSDLCIKNDTIIKNLSYPLYEAYDKVWLPENFISILN
ncbi:MAG: C69 family dipeptidase [Lachnospiraceae bacterium]|nr:C69 family dipeptidase [Lachnospiraceae bacterium]